ncbi:hypothetical protein, partial [Amycolatopsis circi]|uniref:hypothetical protein n=1 Tax=Amycolatopsis circi TaxID=871959 RepID=UPI001ABF9FBB
MADGFGGQFGHGEAARTNADGEAGAAEARVVGSANWPGSGVWGGEGLRARIVEVFGGQLGLGGAARAN